MKMRTTAWRGEAWVERQAFDPRTQQLPHILASLSVLKCKHSSSPARVADKLILRVYVKASCVLGLRVAGRT